MLRAHHPWTMDMKRMPKSLHYLKKRSF